MGSDRSAALQRTASLVIVALGLSLGSLAGPLTGGSKTAPESGAGSADPDSLASFFAQRYGIEDELAATIHRMAVEHDLEPAAVFGVIATESSFNARAVGQAGAVGLMQIKPSTARAYDPGVTRDRLLNPEINLRLGLAHLSRELSHFGHDWTLGLLSYNMGRARLSRALARGVVPRNRYVSKVLAHCGEFCS